MGSGMLYMVGKSFLYAIMFNIVYSESDHEKFRKTGIFTKFGKHINILKTETMVDETVVYHPTHKYLSSTIPVIC